MILSTQYSTSLHPQPLFNLLLKSIGGCYAGVAIVLHMKNKAAAQVFGDLPDLVGVDDVGTMDAKEVCG